MYYSIRHLTKFLYKNAVSESIMETMHASALGPEPALPHVPSVGEPALPRVQLSRPPFANHVHHFDIPGQHGQLVIVAESLVEMAVARSGAGVAPQRDRMGRARQARPRGRLLGDASALASLRQFTPELETLGDELRLRRKADPLSMLHRLNDPAL
jgi:hypothetical protein